MAEVKITITATDKASAVLKQTANLTDNVARAMTGLIVQERNNKVLKEAQERFKELTDSEKKWALAAYDAAEAQDKANKELEEAAKNSGASMKFTELKSQLDLVTGAARQVKESFEEAFEFGKEGAAVRQTTESFDLLLQKVGAAPDLLDRLRKASRGTVDDMTLMSSTATLLAGTQGDLATNLAAATPQLLEIAKAAQKVNPTLGDTSFLYQSIATGIKRAQPDILDNLGLTIKIGEANEKYAKELGKTVEELSAAEKQQALLNATLEAGNILIDQAGGSVDAAGDAYARFTTAQKNLADEQKARYAPAMAFVLEKQAAMMESTRESGTAWMQYIPVLQQVHNLVSGIGAVIGDNADEMAAAERSQRAYGDRWQAQADAIAAATEATEENEDATIEGADAMDYWQQRGHDAAGAAIRMANETRNLRQEQELAAEAAEEHARLLDDQAAAMGRLAEAQQRSNEQFGDKNIRLLDEYNVQGEKRTDVLALMDDKLGTNYVAQEKLDGEMDEAIKLYSQGKISIEELATKMDSTKSAWDGMNENIAAARDGLREADAALRDFMARVQSANGLRAVITVETSAGSSSDWQRSAPDGASADARAIGGPVYANQPVVVGERGWEVYVPPANGTILNHGDAVRALAGGGGPTIINQYIYDITDWEMAARRVTEIQNRRGRR